MGTRIIQPSYGTMLQRSVLGTVFLAGALLLCGCQGFLADRKVSQLDTIVNELRTLNPTTHAATDWQSLESELNSIKATRPGDPSSANQRAASLLETAKSLLETVKVAEANALHQQADLATQVMNANDARSVDATKYEEIQKTFVQASEARLKPDWDDAISSSRKVIADVDNLLVPLKQEAQSELADLERERQQMDRYECQVYAPEMVAEVEQFIASVRTEIEQRRNYRQATESARRGKRTAQDGITKSNRIRAQLQISQLEERLAKSVEEGAEIFAANKFNTTVATFDSIVDAFLKDEYERVLSMIQILRPQVDQLIFLTLSKSTESKLEQLRTVIERHRDGGVEIYLQGRLERLVEKVQGIRDDYAVTSRDPEQFPALPEDEKRGIEESFSNIKTQIQEAFVLSEKIDASFDEMAGNAIRDAEFALNVARDLYTRMEGAFLKTTPADVTPLDADFSRNKSAIQTDLGRRLTNSEELLRRGKNDRANAQYRVAIETAKDVERTADFVQGQVYRTVADNAILELDNQITRFVGEGAADYAADDLNLTRDELAKAKALMTEGKFREATEQTSLVRSQLDVTLQVLGRETLQKIEKAEEAIAQSDELRASQFAPETLGRARSQADVARQALVARMYHNAIQQADASYATAQEASQEAGLAWSRAELETARQAQALADAAGAISYAPLEMRSAQNQYFTARELRNRGLYLAAATTAQEASRSFNGATYRKINDANEAILTSRRSEGWKYESSELTKAIVKAQQAQELLESGNYRTSLESAEQARSLAEEVTAAAQKAGIDDRLSRIQRSLASAEKTGANYFQVTEVKRLLRETEQVRATRSQRNYEDTLEALNRIEAEFEIVIGSTGEQVSGLVERLRAKLEQLQANPRTAQVAAQQSRDAQQYLNFVEVDFEGGNYAAAYKNLKLAMEAIETIDNGLAEQTYQITITALFRELSDALAGFDAVISIGPAVLKRMSFGIQGRGQSLAVANAMPPTQFKQKIDDIYLRILAVEPPPTRKNVHRRAVEAMNEARLAAAEYQKFLIFDEFDRKSIEDTIDNAFVHLKKMEKLRAELQQRLQGTGADLDLVPIQNRTPSSGLLLQSAAR